MKIICAGRQISGKNPVHIVEAVAREKEVRLLCVGNGPLHHLVVAKARSLCPDRCQFIRSLENKELIKKMLEADVVTLNSYYHGWSKVMIEAMLLGKPVIVNQEVARKVKELSVRPKVCEFCPDTADGYAFAIRKMKNKKKRKKLAQRALRWAWLLANPERAQKKQAQAILKVIQNTSTAGRKCPV